MLVVNADAFKVDLTAQDNLGRTGFQLISDKNFYDYIIKLKKRNLQHTKNDSKKKQAKIM